MKKLHLYLAILSLLLVMIGTTIFPDSLAFSMNSASWSFDTLRSLLLLCLVAQLFTNPPRQLWFRVATGVIATTVFGGAIYGTYNLLMPVMDGLILIGASFSSGVTALEKSILPVKTTLTEKKVLSRSF